MSSSNPLFIFSRFTMALNEMKDGMDAKICRSDSRQRPDIRALEIGAFEMAASEKARLEDKQREYREGAWLHFGAFLLSRGHQISLL